MDVLITNPCGKTGLLVQRSLEAHGVSCGVMEGPSARKMEESFIARLKKILPDCNPKMILPIFFPEVLATHRSEFPDRLIPLDEAEKIIRLDNKRLACSLAAELGIPQPKLYSCPDDIQDYPVVFKRCNGQGGDSVYFPRNRKALENLIRTASDYVITDFVDGENVCVDALRWDGYFQACAYRVLEPKGKGVSMVRESIVEPQIIDYTKRILDSVDYHGVCGVDFIRCGGEFFFLECNPRFSGGLESALASGWDLPYDFYLLANGQAPPPVQFTPGVITDSRT